MTFPDAPTPCDAAPVGQSGERERCPMGATLRERVLAVARGEVGVIEDDGANRDKGGRIAMYRAGCVRDRRLLYPGDVGKASRDPWCAAFVSWCVWEAMTWHGYPSTPAPPSGPPPFDYRAAVAEHVADALATGALHVTGDGYVPQAGDVAIMGRAVAGRSVRNPLHGGEGHEGFYVGEDEHGALIILSGNFHDRVGIDPFARSAVLAWIALGP